MVLGFALFMISLFLEWLAGQTGLDFCQLNALGSYFGGFVASFQDCGNFWCYMVALVPIFFLIGLVFSIVGIFSKFGVVGGIFLLLVVVAFLGWNMSGAATTVGFADLGVGAWISLIGAFLGFVGGIAARKKEDDY
ncbi:MAG: hypothetical protein ACTSU5_15865 [Promethearchaeota archaeon]